MAVVLVGTGDIENGAYVRQGPSLLAVRPGTFPDFAAVADNLHAPLRTARRDGPCLCRLK